MAIATKNRNSLLNKTVTMASVFIAAALATSLLFTLMLALIATSFEPRKEARSSIEFVAVDTEVVFPEVTLKIFKEDSSLLREIELPPATETKSSPRASKPKTEYITQLSKVTFLDIPSNIEIGTPFPSFGQGKFGGSEGLEAYTSGTGSARTGDQCTLIAQIGPTTSDISEIEFMDCKNGRVAELAEIELYKWINSGAKSYAALGAQVGDAVEFTYEEKRRVN